MQVSGAFATEKKKNKEGIKYKLLFKWVLLFTETNFKLLVANVIYQRISNCTSVIN